MLAMLVMFMHLFMSFLHFLPHLLVHHHSWCYHARSQGIHRRHARGRWWVWRRVGTWRLASWIPWLWLKMRRPNCGESWIPLGSSWRSGKGAWWKGRIDRWWMDRIGTSRVSNVRGIWIWPWLPSIGIPHRQVCFLQPLHHCLGSTRPSQSPLTLPGHPHPGIQHPPLLPPNW